MPDPKTCASSGTDTWGGQAGAQPGVDGNWTHHHVVSPKQSFVFHSNSLFEIACSDPGCCAPACANAENHQIDFAGIGSFSNQKGYTFPTSPLCFEVHLEDIGEPLGLALGVVDPGGGVAVGLLDDLLGVAAGLGDDPVVGLLGLVDQPFHVLIGLVDLIERRFHGGSWQQAG